MKRVRTFLHPLDGMLVNRRLPLAFCPVLPPYPLLREALWKWHQPRVDPEASALNDRPPHLSTGEDSNPNGHGFVTLEESDIYLLKTCFVGD